MAPLCSRQFSSGYGIVHRGEFRGLFSNEIIGQCGGPKQFFHPLPQSLIISTGTIEESFPRSEIFQLKGFIKYRFRIWLHWSFV